MLVPTVNAIETPPQLERTINITFPGSDLSDWSDYLPPLLADVNNDGIMEIFLVYYSVTLAQNVWLSCDLNGNLIWCHNSTPLSAADPHMCMALWDLDHDGNLELIEARMNGTHACNALTGETFWWSTGVSQYHNIVILERDNIPYIYGAKVGTCYPGGTLSKINGLTGEVVATTEHYHTCYGGISAADLNGDGSYEIILTDRWKGDNECSGAYQPWGGKGLHCYDENLTLLWKNDAIGCSSHLAMIKDINDDGILDVTAFYQGGGNGGIMVVDGSTGAPFSGKDIPNFGLYSHYTNAIGDVDGDGHQEAFCSRYGTSYLKAVDLTTMQIDFTTPYVAGEQPMLMDLYGDSKPELITSGSNVNHVYDANWTEIATWGPQTNIMVSTDCDNDGTMEIIQLNGLNLRIFSTEKEAPSPLPRTDCHYYSEQRLNDASIYIPPLIAGMVTCWKCNEKGLPEYKDFSNGTICGQGLAEDYPFDSSNCGTVPGFEVLLFMIALIIIIYRKRK